MKKDLKHVKLFEAFESDRLSKVINYLNVSNRKNFLNYLKTILNNLNYPYSEISDEYIEYLPFNAALRKANVLTDEVCDATSAKAYPKYAVKDAKCENGKILRKWGSGNRYATCTVCGGTSIKKKNPGDLKLIKFWFSSDGSYLTMTGVDGLIRGAGNKKLVTDLKYYNVVRNLTFAEVLNLPEGSIVSLDIIGNGKDIVCYIYKMQNVKYAINDVTSGDHPEGDEWKYIANKSWGLYQDDTTVTNAKLLKPKNDNNIAVIDPYTWNVTLNSNLTVNTRLDIKKELQKADFALVIDLVKLKGSTHGDLSDIRTGRKKRKEGAFLTPEQIKSLNIQRYLKKLSHIDIIDDVTNVKKLVKKIIQYRYAFFIIMGTNTSNRFGPIINDYYALIKFISENAGNEVIDNAKRDIEDKVKAYLSEVENMQISNVINNTRIELIRKNPGKLEMFDEFVNFSLFLYKKIVQDMEIETIEDLEVINHKIISIKSLMTKGRYATQRFEYFYAYLCTRNTANAVNAFLNQNIGIDTLSFDIQRLKRIIEKM